MSEKYSNYSQKIDDLYTYRDRYFLENDATKSVEFRNQDLQSKINEIVNELESNRDILGTKAAFLVLLGKVQNVMPDFSQTACDSLKKATKLDPKNLEAWNILGECYWKKRDFEMCRNCFEQSLNISRNKKGLRGMSMVIRQLIDSSQSQSSANRYEFIKNSIEESIKFAKESLQLDVKDGLSWYILANCYVSKFFSPVGEPAVLKQAVSAYNLALKDKEVASLQSDLYFNKSMISMYEENWLDALTCLCETLKLDPHWIEARNNLQGTLEYLTQLNEMITKQGKIKEKKFQSMIDSIKRADLGPYLEHTRERGVSEDKPVTKYELIETKLSDLKQGLNKNKVLMGKIICGLPTKNPENIVCFSAVLSDSNGDCAALTIYNLAGGHGVIIGNTVCIPEPWLECQDFTFKIDEHLKSITSDTLAGENKFKFKSIRVENPLVLVVNGKKWQKDKLSSAFFVPKVMND